MTTVVFDSYGQALYDSTGAPLTVEVLGDLWTLPPGPGITQAFFAFEMNVFDEVSGLTSLFASDMGYRTLASDTVGLRVFPAVMDQAFEIDRVIGFAPGSQSTAGHGLVRLSNLGRRYDAFLLGKNSDSLFARMSAGTKTYDQTRGIYVDPSYAYLTPFFTGITGSWTISEDELEIPLFDTTDFIDHPLQARMYAGTGGLNGGADLAGKPIPMVRGGTNTHPVQNVPLTTVDAVNLIYQYTDGPGTIVTLYEGSAAVFTNDGDVANLYAGSAPAAGHYRTCNALGLVQMGSSPVRALTADVTGAFPVAGTVTTAVGIARFLISETMGLPSYAIDVTSFNNADAAYPYIAGVYAGGGETALDIVRFLLWSVGAALHTTRDGGLGCVVLRKLTGTLPSVVISPTTAVSIAPQSVGVPLDPPPFRWRVGYNRVYAVQTSDFNGAVTAPRKAIVGSEFQVATWFGTDVKTGWQRPSDPDVVPTALLVQSDAQALADAWGALWGGQNRLWTVTVPITGAAGLDIGKTVALYWPLVELATGRAGWIVGEQVRSFDSTVQFSVLVNPP